MLVTPLPNETFLRPVQDENAPANTPPWMMVGPLPSAIITLVRFLQPENAPSDPYAPIAVTLPGIVTLVRVWLYSNTVKKMAVTSRLLMLVGIIDRKSVVKRTPVELAAQ